MDDTQELIRAASSLQQQGRILEAIELYTDVLSRLPIGEVFNERALLIMECGTFDKAIIDFTDAIALNPDDADLYVNRGNAYLFLHIYEAALDDYSKAIELSPENAKAFNGRGWVLSQLGDTKDGIEDLKRAIALDASYVSPYFNLALILFYKNADFENALIHLNRANRLKPGDSEILCARGDLFAASLEYTAASKDYLSACETNPTDSRAHVRIARLLSTCKEARFRDGPKALQHANTCCQLTDWSDSDCLEALASAHAECGQFDEAQRCQAKVVQLKPEVVQDLAIERLTLYMNGLPYRE